MAQNSALVAHSVRNTQVVDITDIYKESLSRTIVEPNLWTDEVVADDLFLPYRNLLFFSVASIAAQSEGIKNVYSAFIDSNRTREVDCTEEFFDRLENLLELYGTINIKMPFKHYKKKDVARLGIRLGVPVLETFSCQTNSEVHCGSCPNCVDRLNALEGL